jgi:hypothetical protein
MYLHKSRPFAVKANKPTTTAATAAGGDWNTKLTAAAATVTQSRDLYSIIILPYAESSDQKYHAPDG